jgi:(1->4)-alpha-D-glucan 1-alpha-D-glucosylmutase
MAVTAQAEALLDKVIAHLRSRQRWPEATYRLQFHAGFTFRDAARLVPYFHDLGITDCYASPYLKARPGSQHGYAITDHRTLNPELGSPDDYEAYVGALQARGMGQILDTVPNHMGISGNDNAWWNDILENGPSSPYAKSFDIDWRPVKPALVMKVLVPVLGDPYGKVLESQQLSLHYEGGAFFARYFDHRFPIAPDSFPMVLRPRLEELGQALGAEAPEFIELQSILTALSHLPPRRAATPEKIAERHREKEVIKRRLAALVDASAPVREFIQQNLTLFNGRQGDPHSFDLLDELLNDQAYRLAFWRVAADEINYRRFFDVNDLAALNQEDPETFAATHELILRLLVEGKVTGLRIDHVDGLYDPRQYLQRLQRQFLLGLARHIAASDPAFRADEWPALEPVLLEAIDRAAPEVKDSLLRQPLYVLVEKILALDERLPGDWPVQGTTGYEFLNILNGLFVEPDQVATLSRIYHHHTGTDPSFREFPYRKKYLILQVSLSSELYMLATQLGRLSDKNRWSRDFTLISLRHALREIIACFPVYRSYTSALGDVGDVGVDPRDRQYVEAAVAEAKQKNPAISASLFDFVRDMLLLIYPDGTSEANRAEQRRFLGKFQQVTGPVMAKGLEDTAFYVFNRLVSLNEVGGDPGRFGVVPIEFHRHNQERQQLWPYGLSATSTHDTKRSEDVRARLNVLSELPMEWQKCVARWKRLNKRHRVPLPQAVAPDPNDEYLFYQTLVGAWPLGPVTKEGHREFVRRIQEYMNKAVHEAKVYTSWINPNPAYDEAIRRFVMRTLDEKTGARFLKSLRGFHQRISPYGLFNSLSQTLLKIASPGVPDCYQGTELWDFSLVDPDNRRPVDYELRQRLLNDLNSRLEGADVAQSRLPALARELLQSKEDGRIKLYVVRQALRCRRDHAGLFTGGEYLPAYAHGGQAKHVCAFVRRQDQFWAAAVAPRLLTRLLPAGGEGPLGADVWQDTALVLPDIGPGQRCRNIFTGEVLTTSGAEGQGRLALAEVFAHFPVALLLAQH